MTYTYAINKKKWKNCYDALVDDAVWRIVSRIAFLTFLLWVSYYKMIDYVIIYYVIIVPMCIFLLILVCANFVYDVLIVKRTVKEISFIDKNCVELYIGKNMKRIECMGNIKATPDIYHFKEDEIDKMAYSYTLKTNSKKYYLPLAFYDDFKEVETAIKSIECIKVEKIPFEVRINKLNEYIIIDNL